MPRSEPSVEQVRARLLALRELVGQAPPFSPDAPVEPPDRDLSAAAVARRLEELRALCELAAWVRARRVDGPAREPGQR
jgi:hypothetical protein